MARHRGAYLLASIATALLWVLAWPATGGLTPLAFVAWVPLLLAADHWIQARPEERPRNWLTWTYLALFLWNACTTYWLGLVDEGWGTRLVSGGFPMTANALLMVIPWWLHRAAYRRIGPRAAPVALVAGWLAFEHLHFDWDLQWPWLTLGNVFAVRTGWVQWYEWTGALGGSLWVWGVNLLVARAVLAARQGFTGIARRSGAMALGLVLLPIGVSWAIDAARAGAQGPAVEVVVVQPNIDPYTEKFGGIDPIRQLEGMLALAERTITDSTRLVVLPETALQENATFDMRTGVPVPRGLWENDLTRSGSYAAIRAFQQRHPNAAVLTGMSSGYLFKPGEPRSRTARYWEGIDRWYDAYNAAMLVDERGRVEVYHKSKLVVGVELMPFQSLLEPLVGSFSLDLGGTSGSLGSGEERPILRTADGRIGLVPAICYESVFGDHLAHHARQGANLLAVITNDAWWGDSPGYRQHLAYGRLRAIELRRWVVRSANTGISCFIDDRGRIVDPAPWWTPTALRARVPTSTEPTLFLRFGDVIGRLALAVAVALVAWVLVNAVRRRFAKA
ncbi:MAG: apolipoprotein N-acyltransferase [Flavobacteriales bacterium]|nr:apolipoprotein N-acyltransferase [Flavobacteriales bacterium]